MRQRNIVITVPKRTPKREHRFTNRGRERLNC